jgi:hypothetical protein
LEELADRRGSGEPELPGHEQDVQLAHLQTQRPQGVIVHLGDDPVQQAQARGDAVAGDGVDRSPLLLVVHAIQCLIGFSRIFVYPNNTMPNHRNIESLVSAFHGEETLPATDEELSGGIR